MKNTIQPEWTPNNIDEALSFNLSTDPLVRSFIAEHVDLNEGDMTIDITNGIITIIKDNNNVFRDFFKSKLAKYLFRLWNMPIKVRGENT